jgi:hypothetical protein
MWELIYEDTFGFGEDRDPLKIECSGNDDAEGFFRLWNSVLSESITGPPEKPVKGFARFTLALIFPGGVKKYVCIDMDGYFHELAAFRKDMNPETVRRISGRHYRHYLQGNEKKFYASLK